MKKSITFFLAIICLGIIILNAGVNSYRLSCVCEQEPQEVSLEDLELGRVPQNKHLRIGEHIRVYSYMLFAYKAKRHSSKPSDKSKVSYVLYPIISQENYSRIESEIDHLEDIYGEEDIPDEAYPKVEFSVLVKSKEYKTVGELPEEGLFFEDSIQGVLVSAVGMGIDSRDKKLIQKDYPNIDFDKLLILQQGRRPSSKAYDIGVVIFGLVLIAVGCFFIFRSCRKKSKIA